MFKTFVSLLKGTLKMSLLFTVSFSGALAGVWSYYHGEDAVDQLQAVAKIARLGMAMQAANSGADSKTSAAQPISHNQKMLAEVERLHAEVQESQGINSPQARELNQMVRELKNAN